MIPKVNAISFLLLGILLSWQSRLCRGWTGTSRHYSWKKGPVSNYNRFYSTPPDNLDWNDESLSDPEKATEEWEEIRRLQETNGMQENSLSSSLDSSDAIPDLNQFRSQMAKNNAGSKGSLSAALSIPDFGIKKEKIGATKISKKSKTKGQSKPQQERTKETSATIASNIPNDVTVSPSQQNDSDGLYLAPDLYQRSRDMLQADGSLDLESELEMSTQEGRKAILEQLLQAQLASKQAPSIGNVDQEERDISDAWAEIQEIQSKPFNASKAEELHQQVFEKEEGYLNQSDQFRKALTDPQVAKQQTYERRSAQYKARQAKALEDLDQTMAEFEQLLKNRQQPELQTCSRCSVKLTLQDLDVAPQLWMRTRNLTALCRTCYMNMVASSDKLLKQRIQKENEKSSSKPPGVNGSSQSPPAARPQRSQSAKANAMPTARPISSQPRRSESTNRTPTARPAEAQSNSRKPKQDNRNLSSEDPTEWVAVKDPDTGETFYWNEELDEMRRDL